MMSQEEQTKMLNDTMKFAVPFILLCVCIVFGGVYFSTEMEKKKKAIETGIYEDAIPLGDTLVRVEDDSILIKNGEGWVTAFSEFDKPIEQNLAVIQMNDSDDKLRTISDNLNSTVFLHKEACGYHLVMDQGRNVWHYNFEGSDLISRPFIAQVGGGE